MTIVEVIDEARRTLANMKSDPAKYWKDECLLAYADSLDEAGTDSVRLAEEDSAAFTCGFGNYVDAYAEELAEAQPQYKALEKKLDAVFDAVEELESALP